MNFRPNPNDELTITGVTYRIAEHPSAPGMPYGQEGRAGIVYRLFSSGGESLALKIFNPRFRLPYLVSQAEKLFANANLPGLQAARRIVLTPTRHADLLHQHPDLTYAVLMPWIEGPTWLEIVLDKKPFALEQSLSLAHAMADILVHMEERGLAHCDLSGPNVMLPALVGGEVALIDLEGLYAPGMIQPQAITSGSAGYAHQQASDGLWGSESDRFAGAVLLAEILGWCDPQVCQFAWSESYFEPKEMQKEGERYRTLITSLRSHWGDGAATLFERAWHSDSLADCPTFGEWLVTLPNSSEQREVRNERATPNAESPLPPVQRKFESVVEMPQETPDKRVTAEIRAFMQAARRMEELNDRESALRLYHQAQELASTDSALYSLKNEISLVMQNVTNQQRENRQEMPSSGVKTTSTVRITPENICRLNILRALKGYESSVHAMAFSPDGRLLASGETDGTVRLWQIADGNLLCVMKHNYNVLNLAFSSDGAILLGASSDEYVHLWRVPDGAFLRKFGKDYGRVTFSANFSSNRSLLATGLYGAIHVWQVSEGILLQNFGKPNFYSAIWSVDFSPDDSLLSISVHDRVELWRINDGITILTLRGHSNSILSTKFSPDGEILASGAADCKVLLWHVSDGTLLQALEGHTNSVLSLAFSSDGTILSSAGGDRIVQLWRVSDGMLLHTLEGYNGSVTNVAFSPNGTMLASASDDGTMRLWGIGE